MFDTQCEHNLVSTKFLEEIGFKWQPSTVDTQITQMDNANIECLGEVHGRWYPVGAPKRPWYLAVVPKRLQKGLNFRPRYESSTFKIVDLDTFDLIIGRDTINELGLLQINRNFFGGFRPSPIRVDSDDTTTKKQQEADERRKKDLEAMRKRDEEKALETKAN
ncbi:hypothetical protein COCMIDRAFT_7459 [Bipolaris oryzae ATCC 44560]|uniref:Uncharacterized protein n=1 Tax=Bipolaris oryzae ATCC 44560 TaxID=930090 RepID=W6ZHL4_COCMI|nr:uncharacterized protein COCMIDRAFT_7459 [Bipolaris oryzae ATCC 44560]EUC43051.1 hypothetical protein COCMIDRAFT_7459 [Bipolaris oryzae ATCC 44560]